MELIEIIRKELKNMAKINFKQFLNKNLFQIFFLIVIV